MTRWRWLIPTIVACLLAVAFTWPRYEVYRGDAAVEITANDPMPFVLVAGKPGVTYEITAVSVQVVGVTSVTGYPIGRFSVWFDSPGIDSRVHSVRFKAVPDEPGMSAYPPILTCAMFAPAANEAIMVGFGPAVGGMLKTGSVAVRVFYEET